MTNQRPPVAFSLLALTIVVLAAATTYSTWKWRQSETALALSETNAELLSNVNDFLVRELPGRADPFNIADRDTKLLTVLNRSARRVEKRFRDNPIAEAEARFHIGRGFYRIGVYESALVQFEESLKIRQRELGDDHTDTWQATLRVGNAKHKLGEHEEAVRIFDRVIGTYKSGHNPETANLLEAMMLKAGSLAELDRLHEAEEAAKEYLNASYNDKDLNTYLGMEQLAKVHFARKQYEACEDIIRQRMNMSSDEKYLINASNILGLSQMARGDAKSASQTFEKLLAIVEDELGDEHTRTLECAANYAQAQIESGETGNAKKVLDIYLPISTKIRGPAHEKTEFMRELRDRLMQKSGNEPKSH